MRLLVDTQRTHSHTTHTHTQHTHTPTHTHTDTHTHHTHTHTHSHTHALPARRAATDDDEPVARSRDYIIMSAWQAKFGWGGE